MKSALICKNYAAMPLVAGSRPSLQLFPLFFSIDMIARTPTTDIIFNLKIVTDCSAIKKPSGIRGLV